MDSEAVEIERKFVGAVRGEVVHLRNAAAGAVAAGRDLTITNGGCGPVAVGHDLTITNGGCGPALAGGSVSFTNGGAQTVIAGGGATIGSRAFVGIVLSPSVTVEDGGRILLGTPQALAFGAVAGVVAGLVAKVARPRQVVWARLLRSSHQSSEVAG